MMVRGGATLGDPTNCKNLLEDEQAILVFPEGVRGSGKAWGQRYQLQRFGRGFLRLALQTKTPIVPIGVVGGEESLISLKNWEGLAKLLGAPYIPIPALLPILGLGSFLPMPVKFYLRFGEPLVFDGPHDDEDSVIDGKVTVVKRAITALIAQGRRERTSLF
jgi:1-acyl-sn-glycerol-3-phosphate acyltransferase